MGCCVSTTNGKSRISKKDENFQVGFESLNPKSSSHESRAPPDEETVKQVLSETPKSKPPIKNFLQKHQFQEVNSKKKFHIDQKLFLDDEKKIKNQTMSFQEEDHVISEHDISEVCSLSLSETVSTATFNNDKNDYDEDDVKQSVKRSPASRLPRNDRIVGKSPTRKPEQSPDKRSNIAARGSAMRLVYSKESGNYQAGGAGLRSDLNRKDPVGEYGRRSRSPTASRSVTGRSPSIRRKTGSRGRFRTCPPESGGRVESNMNGKWPSTSSNAGGGVNYSTKETLENPLVSLECFIFL